MKHLLKNATIFVVLVLTVAFIGCKIPIQIMTETQNQNLMPRQIQLSIQLEIVSEKDLKQFNKEPYSFGNGRIDIGSEQTIKILFLGNSLTYTSAPEEEADKELRGLTATSKDKDYVHQLMKMISENKNVNIDYSVVNIAAFERNFSRTEFDYRQLEKVETDEPDYLVVQIGENISCEDMKNYGEELETKYAELVRKFPKAIKIVCLPFWPDKEKINRMTNIAVTNNCFLIDLSHLGSGIDELNFASSYKKYKQPGVGAHPGDYGMENIAKNIYTVINSTLKKQKKA